MAKNNSEIEKKKFQGTHAKKRDTNVELRVRYVFVKPLEPSATCIAKALHGTIYQARQALRGWSLSTRFGNAWVRRTPAVTYEKRRIQQRLNVDHRVVTYPTFR